MSTACGRCPASMCNLGRVRASGFSSRRAIAVVSRAACDDQANAKTRDNQCNVSPTYWRHRDLLQIKTTTAPIAFRLPVHI